MTRADDYEIVMLDTWKRAVAEVLERKRLLGQYAVVWRNGRAVCIGPDAPVVRDPSGTRSGTTENDQESERAFGARSSIFRDPIERGLYGAGPQAAIARIGGEARVY